MSALRALEPSLSGVLGLFSRLEQGAWDGSRIVDPLAE
jgi:hypothetical protein